MSVSNLSSLLDASNGLPSPNSLSSEQDFVTSTMVKHAQSVDAHKGSVGALPAEPAEGMGHHPSGIHGFSHPATSVAARHPSQGLTGYERSSQQSTALGDDMANLNDPTSVFPPQSMSHTHGQYLSSQMAYSEGSTATDTAGTYHANHSDYSFTTATVASSGPSRVVESHDHHGHAQTYGMPQPSLEQAHAASQDARANAFHYQYHGSTPTQFQLQSMNHLQAMSHRAGSGDSAAKADTPIGGNDKDDKHHGCPSLSGAATPTLKLESDAINGNGCDGSGKSSHDPQQGSSGQNSAASSTPTTPRIAPPNTYKRFRNAFIYFVNEQRKARNPGQQSIKNREFVQMMSLEWRALSEDEKKPYTEMARLDRERYDKDVETHGRIPPKPAKSSLQSKSAGLSSYSNQSMPSINFTDWRTLPHDMANQHYQFMGAARDPSMYHLPMEHFSKLGHRPGEPMQSYDYLLYNYPHTPNKVMGVTHSLPNSMPNTPGLPTPGGHTPNPVSDVTPPPAMDHRASAAAGPYMNGGGGGQGFPTPSISTPNSAIPSPQSQPHGGSSQAGVSGARHNPTMTSLLPSTTQNMPHPSLLQPTAQGFYPPHGAPHAPSTLSNPNGPHGSNLPSAGHSTSNGVGNYGFTHGAVSSMVPLANPYSSHAAMAAVHNAQGMGMQQPQGSSAQGLAQMDVNGLSLGHNVNNNIQMINGVPTMLGNAPGSSDANGNVVSGPGIQSASYMVTGAGPQPATAGSIMAETKLSRTKSVRTKKDIKSEL